MSRTNRKWKDAGVAVCVRMRRLTAPIAGVVVHPELIISSAFPGPFICPAVKAKPTQKSVGKWDDFYTLIKSNVDDD